jgi:hypothetical protein
MHSCLLILLISISAPHDGSVLLPKHVVFIGFILFTCVKCCFDDIFLHKIQYVLLSDLKPGTSLMWSDTSHITPTDVRENNDATG